MAGGVMQIVAYGPQDVFLTGNPEITFFKVMYRRHTNFAIESIEQTFSGTVDFGRKVTCLISRNADLLDKVYLQVDLPALTKTGGSVAWTRNIGHVLIDEVSLDIGGQTIDKQYGEWLTIWNELTQTAEKRDGYDVMIGNTTVLTDNTVTPETTPATTLYVPLQFWFCRNHGLALPLIALQYHEVKFNITFRSATECYITDNGAAPDGGVPSLSNASLWCNYIFLDNDERRQFAQSQHEYLIEQLQFTTESFSNTTVKTKLALNHPCKALIWVLQLDANVATNVNRWSDFTNSGGTGIPYGGTDPLYDAKLQLNGSDRFATRTAGYFNLVQPNDHFPSIPSTGIYVYSFALFPAEHQPSGSCNFSRIDNANLNMTLTTSSPLKMKLYAINYNILRIMSGMGGVAYSN